MNQERENLSFSDMFPDIEEIKEKEPSNKAAAELFVTLSDNEEEDTRSKRLHFRLSPATHLRLRAMSKKRGIPISTLVNMIIVDYLDNHSD